MKLILALIAILVAMIASSCSVNPAQLDKDYVQEFASKVRCAKGYKGGCWCFVATRTSGAAGSTGIGMTAAPNKFCE